MLLLDYQKLKKNNEYNKYHNDVITISNDGCILSWNEEAGKIYGYSNSDVLGRDISMLTPLKFKKEKVRLEEYNETLENEVKIRTKKVSKI